MADFGFAPFEETSLRSRLRLGGLTASSAARRIAEGRASLRRGGVTLPGEIGDDTTPGAKLDPSNPERSGPGGFKRILGEFLTGGGLQASLIGLGSVPRGANFGEAFLAAAGGAGRAGAALSEQAAEAAERRRRADVEAQRLGFEERRLQAEEARLEKEQGDPSNVRTYEALLARGFTKERAAELAFGATVAQRAEQRETPQGELDVQDIAAHYGVSPTTARVLKVSGATRIRPRVVTTTGTDPITGKPFTRTQTVNEPVALWTARETAARIEADTNLARLDAIAGGDIPDEVPDDPELQNRVRQMAAMRARILRARAISPRAAQNQ